jgi:hypothetical protein
LNLVISHDAVSREYGWYMSLYKPACVLLILGAASHCGAQNNVKLLVLEGHNGRPVTNARVSVRVVRNSELHWVDATIAGDQYTVSLEKGDTIALGNVTASNRSWNEYRLCVKEQEDRPIYSVATIMSAGVNTPNRCSKQIMAKASPNEIVFFVTRMPFWQRLNLFRD